MTSDRLDSLPEDYTGLLESLKARVRQTRMRAQRTVNAELIGLYWGIGREILDRQNRQGWGSAAH